MKSERSRRVLDIFVNFFRFGCFTFGGGWSIVAQIQKEYVEKKRWITDEELLDFTSVGRSIPGLMVGNASVLFGYQAAGIPGALVALLGVVLPPFLIMIAVTFIYGMVKDNVYVARAMMGVRAAVVPIIVSALVKLFKAGMKDAFCYGIAAMALLLSLFTPINNVFIVLAGALMGILYTEVKHRAVH
jgi:chromate transporter